MYHCMVYSGIMGVKERWEEVPTMRFERWQIIYTLKLVICVSPCSWVKRRRTTLDWTAALGKFFLFLDLRPLQEKLTFFVPICNSIYSFATGGVAKKRLQESQPHWNTFLLKAELVCAFSLSSYDNSFLLSCGKPVIFNPLVCALVNKRFLSTGGLLKLTQNATTTKVCIVEKYGNSI